MKVTGALTNCENEKFHDKSPASAVRRVTKLTDLVSTLDDGISIDLSLPQGNVVAEASPRPGIAWRLWMSRIDGPQLPLALYLSSRDRRNGLERLLLLPAVLSETVPDGTPAGTLASMICQRYRGGALLCAGGAYWLAYEGERIIVPPGFGLMIDRMFGERISACLYGGGPDWFFCP